MEYGNPIADPLEYGLKVLSRLATALVVLIGGLTLLGWALGVPVLIRLLPSVVVMNPLSALLFVCAGLALWFRQPNPLVQGMQAVRFSLVLAGLVALIGALKLADYAVGFHFYVDQFLFPSRLPLFSQYRGSEMAPNTALGFLFSGLALLLFSAKDRKRFCPDQVLVLATSLIALMALVGYIYRVLVLNSVGTLKPMSLESAVAFALFCMGFLAAQPKRGFMLTITNRTTGGTMARRLLPMAFLVPLLLGLLLLAGEKAGYFREELALSIFAVSNIVIFTALISWNAKLLYRTDLDRVRTERRLAAQHNATRVLVEAPNLDVGLPRVLQAVCEALGWQIGAVWTLDHHAARLRCTQIWSSNDSGLQEFVRTAQTTVLPADGGLPGQVWSRGQPVWSQDVAQLSDDPLAGMARHAGLHGAFAVPIWSAHKIFGALEFFSRYVEPPDPDLLEMMGIVGTQIGLFIERTRAEAQLRDTSANLQRSNTELQQFAHVASHDLFEPLRMITSYLQLLQQHYHHQLDARAAEFIGFALDGAKRMDALIHDLLVYSRVDVRGRSLEPTAAEQALDAALSNLKVAIEETGATITRGPLPWVRADSVQLTQVFQNLIGNAIKFHGPEPPRVEIEARRQNNEWRFLVRDNGIGFESKFFDTVFVIFQRLHTRQEYAGTGMGLAICKKIIERHGGRIWVESVPGKGSTFYFTLPAIDGAGG